MSAFVETNDGITSPGQSQRINDSSRYNVYKQPTYIYQAVRAQHTQIWSQNDHFCIPVQTLKFPTVNEATLM